LRRYVLEGRQLFPTQPLGLALWLAKGMAGWMRQWTELLPATAPPAAPVPSRPVVTGPWQAQLTLVLAQMTLEHLQPRSSL
jgi:hypothetical protein